MARKKEVEKVTYSLTRESPVTWDFAGVRQNVHIRKTDESASRVSVIDVLAAITGQRRHGDSNAAVTFGRVNRDYPEVTANSSDFKICGQGQSTPKRRGQWKVSIPK